VEKLGLLYRWEDPSGELTQDRVEERIRGSHVEQQRNCRASNSGFEFVSSLPQVDARAAAAKGAVEIEIVEVEIDIRFGITCIIQADIKIVTLTAGAEREDKTKDLLTFSN